MLPNGGSPAFHPPPRGRVRRGPFGSAARRTDPRPRSVGAGRALSVRVPLCRLRVIGQASPWPRFRPLSGAFRPLLPAAALCRCLWTGPAAAQGAGREDNGYWYKSPSLWLRLKFSAASQGPGLRECQPWGVNPQNPKGFSTLFRALCSKASVLNEGGAPSYSHNNGRGGRAAQADRVQSSARYGWPGRPGQFGNREAWCALPLSGHTTPIAVAAHLRQGNPVTAAKAAPAGDKDSPAPSTRARPRPLSRLHERPPRHCLLWHPAPGQGPCHGPHEQSAGEAVGASRPLIRFFPVQSSGENRKKTSSFFCSAEEGV